MSFEFCNHFDVEERVGCFTLIVFLMFCDSQCCVVFLVDEGKKDSNTFLSGPSSAPRNTPLKWRFAGVPMLAQH